MSIFLNREMRKSRKILTLFPKNLNITIFLKFLNFKFEFQLKLFS
jgi:hypothetical protein